MPWCLPAACHACSTASLLALPAQPVLQPGAHSPPHSPGRRIINQVLGPSLVRRLAPAQQPADKATDGGPETAGDSPPPPPPQCAPSALARQATAPARPPRHPDPFRLWPTPSETAAAAAGVSGEAHAGPGQARRPGAVTFAPLPDGAPLPRLASLRPEAREMQAASAVEGEVWSACAVPGRLPSAAFTQRRCGECSTLPVIAPATLLRCCVTCPFALVLASTHPVACWHLLHPAELFSTRSARLDSACSQQVDWADR